MVLSQAEIVTYYSRIFKIHVPNGEQTLLVPCLFCRHSEPVSVFLKTGRWSCRCGSGDLLEFEARRTQREHYLRCQERILEILAGARQEHTTIARKPSGSPAPTEPETFQTRDARRLLGKIARHPGGTRAYYQRCSHWPSKRFQRALSRLEREGLVCRQELPTTCGRKRLTYYPFLERETPSNLEQKT